MSRAETPFSSAAEIAAYRQDGSAPPHGGALSPSIIEFCQSGVAAILGIHDPLDGPISGVGIGARVLPNGRMRFLLRRPGNERLLLALMRDCRIAVTFTRPVTHRSVQLKGSDAMISAPTPDDIRVAEARSRAFRDELLDAGHPVGFSTAWNAFDAADLVVVEFTPTAVFAQTPGPAAGTELTA